MKDQDKARELADLIRRSVREMAMLGYMTKIDTWVPFGQERHALPGEVRYAHLAQVFFEKKESI